MTEKDSRPPRLFAHPINNSNTYYLETVRNWTGICIDANPQFVQLLKAQRRAKVAECCIDESPSTVEFVYTGQLGGIIADDTDNNASTQQQLEQWTDKGLIRTVSTTTLASVLEEHKAPKTIHYLSLDVEWAEERILRTFPFNRYTFLAMTVERPTPAVNKLLLDTYDYVFVRNVFTAQLNENTESFYIHRSIDRDDITKQPFAQVPPKPW